MPVGIPPHKEVPDDPGAEHRVEMCRLAAAGDEWLDVSRLEVDRPGPSYTVDTLREIHAQAPEHELTFIVGGDMAQALPAWREPEAVLELARLGVADRGGVPRERIVERLRPLGRPDRVAFFDMPRVDVSSSLVRGRVVNGLPIRHLVPDAVAGYVAEHGLYRAAVPSGGARA
jgi:nicotinate-nucleotide adenylyltransferase